MKTRPYDAKRDEKRNDSGNYTDGTRSQPAKKKAVAYCTNKIHPMNLSAATVKKHGCLNVKGGICPYMIKYEHEYWAQRDRLKATKKAACA